MKGRCALWLVIAMVCGVFLFYTFPGTSVLYVSLSVMLFFFLLLLFNGRRVLDGLYSFLTLLSVGLLSGTALGCIQFYHLYAEPSNLSEVEGYVVSFPLQKGRNTRYGFRVKASDNPSLIGRDIALYIREKSLKPGTCLKTLCRFTPSVSLIDSDLSDAPATHTPIVDKKMLIRQGPSKADHSSSYGKWLLSKGFSGVAYGVGNCIILGEDKTSPKVKSLLFNLALRNRLRTLPLTDENIEALASMTLGRGPGSEVSATISEKYRMAGAAHILAVSGFHLGVVAAILYLVLTPLRLFCIPLSDIFLVSGIWLFSWVCGLSPSTLRAALMITLYLLSSNLPYPADNINVLAVSALILLMINPASVFDVGFALSYVSVLSILLIMPLFREIGINPENPLVSYLWNIFLVTLSVQPFTLPLTLYYFGKHSVPGILLNIPLAFLSSLLMPPALLWMLCSHWGIKIDFLDRIIQRLSNANGWLLDYFTEAPLPQMKADFSLFELLISWSVVLVLVIGLRARLESKRAFWQTSSHPYLSLDD